MDSDADLLELEFEGISTFSVLLGLIPLALAIWMAWRMYKSITKCKEPEQAQKGTPGPSEVVRLPLPPRPPSPCPPFLLPHFLILCFMSLL